MFSALSRLGADVTVRSIPDLDKRRIKELQGQDNDFVIFTDLAATLGDELEEALDGRFLAIDHHQIPEDYADKPYFLNAWQYGYDGGKEACSSTMAYIFASTLDPANKDLSHLAVVGAVADRQDAGPGRSLTGLNRRALEDAQSAGLIKVTKDLVLTGRETRPIHESIAMITTPFLPGLSGSKDAVLASLLQAGLAIKDGPRWRTAAEFTSDEKMKVTELIAGALGTNGGSTEALAGLIGEVYTVSSEDAFTPLRDAREFGTLLNACGRMGVAGVGMALCLGDRGAAFRDAMKTLADYRMSINKAVQGLTGDGTRSVQHGSVVLVRGEDLVDEKILGPVTSIITSSQQFKDKVVVATARSGESELKVSSRVGDLYGKPVNLGVVMREAAEAVDGVGGGHSMAAGAKIPTSKAEAFSKLVLEKIAA
jgi:single-stranded-DNA-specific exonuclease